ncbi:MAG: PQQ-like beta-propeller repeat protein [Planctomycetaceae bacterium]|nr:PQQ-like beta-propeller repeat protein [Planctomycetaceae bacterium]
MLTPSLRTTVTSVALLSVIFGSWSTCGIARAEEDSACPWPQWRGPTRDGIVSGSCWPDSLSEEALHEAWRVELGPSYSGPIVTSEHVIVTETVDKKSESVRAFDRRTGEGVWRVSWPGAMSVPFFAKANGDWFRSTPACDGEHIFVAGMRDVLVCLRVDTGQELWRTDITTIPGGSLESFGFVCSPLIDGDGVIVQTGAGIVRLEKRTGVIQWRVETDDGGMSGGAFSSPVTATLQGKRQLVVQTREQLQGRDVQSGNLLWSIDIPAFRGMNILTPTVLDDRIFTSSYGGGSFMVDVKTDGNNWTAELLWENKIEGYMSSPIVRNGFIYLHLRNQRLTCLDAETGKEQWRSKPFGKYLSMLVHDDEILALDERGELLLFQANPTAFELLQRRQISESPTWSYLGMTTNNLFLRELNGLVCYRRSQDGND